MHRKDARACGHGCPDADTRCSTDGGGRNSRDQGGRRRNPGHDQRGSGGNEAGRADDHSHAYGRAIPDSHGNAGTSANTHRDCTTRTNPNTGTDANAAAYTRTDPDTGTNGHSAAYSRTHGHAYRATPAGVLQPAADDTGSRFELLG